MAIVKKLASEEFVSTTVTTVVTEEVTTSLAVAKESGDFKGDKGDKGDQGPAGPQGAKGDKGDQGPKGDTGAAGYSPVRGTDYWTDADKAEIKSYVDEAILGGAW